MFISVDLPEPDGPMIATNSPRSISNETPLRTCTGHLAEVEVLDQILDRDDGAPCVPQNPGPPAATRRRRDCRRPRAPTSPAPRRSRGRRPSARRRSPR